MCSALTAGSFYNIPANRVVADGDGVREETEFVYFEVLGFAYGSHRPKIVPLETPDDTDLAFGQNCAVQIQYLGAWVGA